jgi:hypothetical protein
LQESTVCGVTFIFVPGHAGVSRNERADWLASLATIADGQPMDHTDIVNALGEICRGEDFEGSESTSLVIRKNLGVKIGTAITEKYIRNMRHLVSQHRTRSVSRWTLYVEGRI